MCVISQKYKCIFVHIPKNAGGSVRQAILALDGKKPGGIHQHAPALTLRKLNPAQYDSFFSFAIVRNPWDRMWSFYKFALSRKGKGHPDIGDSFDDYLLNKKGTHNWAKTFKDPLLPAQRRSQLEWITDDDGKIIVSFVVKYEDLAQDLDIVYNRIGLPPLTLAFHHSTSRAIHYTDAYSQDGIDFISEHFAKDIQMFDYGFGK